MVNKKPKPVNRVSLVPVVADARKVTGASSGAGQKRAADVSLTMSESSSSSDYSDIESDSDTDTDDGKEAVKNPPEIPKSDQVLIPNRTRGSFYTIKEDKAELETAPPAIKAFLKTLEKMHLRRLVADRKLAFAENQKKVNFMATLLRDGFNDEDIVDKAFIKPLRTLAEIAALHQRSMLSLCPQKTTIGDFGRHRVGVIFKSPMYCESLVGIPLTTLNKLFKPLEEQHLKTKTFVPKGNCLKELLVCTLDFARSLDPIQNIFLRNLIRPPVNPIKSVKKLLSAMISANGVNFGPADQVLFDESTFASAGFPGIVLSMALIPYKINRVKKFVLLGVNNLGDMRHFELLEGYIPAEALRSSDFYKEVNKENFGKFNWPSGFKVKEFDNKTVDVPTCVLFDTNLMVELQEENTISDRSKNHIMTPCDWRLDASKHTWITVENMDIVGQHLGNASWVVEDVMEEIQGEHGEQFFAKSSLVLEFAYKLNQLKKLDDECHILKAGRITEKSIPINTKMEAMGREEIQLNFLKAFTNGCVNVSRSLPAPNTREDRVYPFYMHQYLVNDPNVNLNTSRECIITSMIVNRIINRKPIV